ncbi:MAG: hypothetical protein KDD55_13915 [Bdellovibrionales bacterium]|nr:hypothetical protein [Bdellovibrionales bacterium]
MHLVRLIVFLSALTLSLSACSKGPESAAKDFCACAKPLFDKMSKVNEAMSKGDFSVLQSMSQEMESIMPKMQSCMKTLEEKYGDLKENEEFKNAVTKEIDRQCPNPIKKMGAMPSMGVPGS